MTRTPAPGPAPAPAPPETTAQAWRGIAAEDVEDIPASLASLLRLRGRRLLQDLLRPHRARAGLILLLIVIANLAALVGPWLVGVGIDQIPRLTRSSSPVTGSLAVVIAAFAITPMVAALDAAGGLSCSVRLEKPLCDRIHIAIANITT